MKNKSKRLIVIGILICILGVIGISYALWNKVFVQSGENLVNSDCFELTFEEKGGIQLENSFPTYDSDGKKLKPYTFKISNKCNNEVDYQLNLETTNNTTLKDNYIKVMLNDGTPSLYSSKEEVEVTITNGKGARVLESGILSGNEVKEYELRVWMDERVTQNDEGAMNGVFESKITITATYRKPTLASIIKNQPIVTSGNGLYEVSHSDAEITYTSDINAQNLLKETEYRYAGSNPDNYVLFNNELWRIIGLVNTPEGQRVKIIRDESIGNYSWDVSDSNINYGWGINEWSQSNILKVLNALYFNRSNGTCFKGKDSGLVDCDFREIGLTDETKEMIDTITWNLGSNGNLDYADKLIKDYYNYERSNNTGKICNGGNLCDDNVTRTTTWKGRVGLMYPSDYGYATSGNDATSRATCFNTALWQWKLLNPNDCSSTNWIHHADYQWMMNPRSFTNSASFAFGLDQGGYVTSYYLYEGCNVRPSVFLRELVVVLDGDGTKEYPYILSI